MAFAFEHLVAFDDIDPTQLFQNRNLIRAAITFPEHGLVLVLVLRIVQTQSLQRKYFIQKDILGIDDFV